MGARSPSLLSARRDLHFCTLERKRAAVEDGFSIIFVFASLSEELNLTDLVVLEQVSSIIEQLTGSCVNLG